MLLDQILARTKERLMLRMSITPRSQMEKRARGMEGARDFLSAIRRKPGGRMRLIGEFRRANPIRGVLRADLDPARFAASCSDGGVSAISACTEEEHFRGNSQDLAAMRAVTHLPVLRKDYIFDQYQVYESRALGADAVSLSLSLLDRSKLRDLLTCLKDLGMTGVVEVGEERELGIALAVGAQCLRIDNRDPRTLRPVQGKAQKLRILIPPDLALIVEGELGNRQELQQWDQEKADALLLSEPLILAAEPSIKVRELLT